MKIGAFLLGGVAGAAAVIYLNRKSRNMMMSAFSSSSESMGKVMDRAKDKFVSKTFNDSSHDSSSKSYSSASAGNAGGLNQVEKIVKEDPTLKSTVNEILQENEKSSATIQ